jgi:hypothetical protein
MAHVLFIRSCFNIDSLSSVTLIVIYNSDIAPWLNNVSFCWHYTLLYRPAPVHARLLFIWIKLELEVVDTGIVRKQNCWLKFVKLYSLLFLLFSSCVLISSFLYLLYSVLLLPLLFHCLFMYFLLPYFLFVISYALYVRLSHTFFLPFLLWYTVF